MTNGTVVNGKHRRAPRHLSGLNRRGCPVRVGAGSSISVTSANSTKDMDKSISVGDLVAVVKPTGCGCVTTLGRIFLVTGLKHNSTVCLGCKAWDKAVRLLAQGDGNNCYPVSRLKRIPPLDELDGVDSWEELNTPVLL